VTSALLHGGTSTVYALGRPPEAEYWRVAVENPPIRGAMSPTFLATVPLKNQAMSVSAVWGKSFKAGGKTFGHVLDPRTGAPAMGAVLAAVVLPCATETDALSTALLVLGAQGHKAIANLRPGMRTLVVIESDGEFRVEAKDIVVSESAFSGESQKPVEN